MKIGLPEKRFSSLLLSGTDFLHTFCKAILQHPFLHFVSEMNFSAGESSQIVPEKAA